MAETTLPQWPSDAIWQTNGLRHDEAAIVPLPDRFRASDGYDLATLTWPAPASPRARAILLHGVQSHAGWYHGLGRRLAATGYECVFIDRRGSGANNIERGHAPSADRLIQDVTELLQHEKSKAQTAQVPLVLAGISWGAKIAVVAATRSPSLVDALVLLCPGLHPRVTVGLREKLGVALALLTGQGKKRHFPIPLADPALFTDNPAAQNFLRNDPFSLRTASASLLFASRTLDRWVAGAAERVTCRTLLLLAEHDRIVDNQKTLAYAARIAPGLLTTIHLADTHHTPEFEIDPGRYVREVIRWLDGTVSSQDSGAARWTSTNA